MSGSPNPAPDSSPSGLSAWLSRCGATAICGLLVAVVGPRPADADVVRDRQWHLYALDVAEAHTLSRGAGVVVAVIDTGVRADHRDLVGAVLPGVDLTGAGTRGQQDTDGHGTAMAGLIAGHGHGPGTADGVLGIAPQAKILPIRAGTDRLDQSAPLPAAVGEAVRLGASVLSVAIGPGTDGQLRDAVRTATEADVVVIVAADNWPHTMIRYPGAYPGVLTVAAAYPDGTVTPTSGIGDATGITAPGEDTMTTDRTGTYQYTTGTSDAAAIVAGAAALLRAKHPTLSATEVVHRLTATATDRGAPGRDPEYGHGALNIVKALTTGPAQAPPGRGGGPAPSGTSPTNAAPPDGGGGSTGLDLIPVAHTAGGLCLLVMLAGIRTLRARRHRTPRRQRGPW